MTMTLLGRTERLLEHEYLLLEQLIAFREQSLTGENLKDAMGLVNEAPDRLVRAAMGRLIRKANALHPSFPLVRQVQPNAWIFTETAPKKKKPGK